MSKWEAIGQMLVANQWMDKLAALCTIFKSCGMLEGTCLSDILHEPCMSFNSFTLIPSLADNLIGQKKLTEVHTDNIPMDKNGDSEEDGDDDNVAISVPNIQADVKLAKTVGKYNFLVMFTY